MARVGTRAKSAAERAIALVEAAQEYEPEATPEAMQLLTVTGICNAIADVYQRAAMGGNRDENSSWRMQLKCLEQLSDIVGKVLTIDTFQEVSERISRVEEFLSRKAAGAATSFAEGFDPPPAKGTGAN